MSTYHMVFADLIGDRPIRTMTFSGEDAVEAIDMARYHFGRIALWIEEGTVCSLVHASADGATLSSLLTLAGTPQNGSRVPEIS
jgi:hypothetical protein